ncbi:hypothetical protein G6F22_011973 [Rhizopus arrhizus]|nr:hypothetical protein G6F22_011973 [Rhizopus arrhizus]KAG1216596.1 hypothetical protein G6F35_009949 [Rhizopus arrhizus]
MSTNVMQFNSIQEELDYWRSHAENLEGTLQETRAALDEFQVSSRELEEELEKELQTTEKAYNDLKSRCEHFKRDAEDWKSKYTESKHEQNLTMVQMQREIDILRATEESFRKKKGKAATSSLTDLEMKLNKAIERNAILEQEISAKDNLTEQTQRLKDELNEVNQELSVSRAQETKQREFISELENKLEELEKKNRHQLAMNNRSSTPDFDPYNARQSRVPRNSSASNPVKMVQDMVGRVRKHVYSLVVPWSPLY